MPDQRPWFYWLVRTVVRYGFFVLSGGLRVLNAKNVPRKGACIIAPNHTSYLDPPAIGCSSPRRVRFFAKRELFRNKLFGAVISALGSFPVQRGTADLEALKLSINILKNGDPLLVFPEGTRGPGDGLLPFNRGVAVLAQKTQAPVVPTVVLGTTKKWGKGSKLPRFGRVTVSYGMPLNYSDYQTTGNDRQDQDLFTSALRSEMIKMFAELGVEVKSES